MPRRCSIVAPALTRLLRERFALDWYGAHGASHWARVRQNGLLLTEHTGASPRVVELFAFLHDSCREDEYHDAGHGARAAAFVAEIREQHLNIADEELDLLIHAIRHHSDGLMEADVTVQTCWDADRLDLGRVGIRPAPHRLCTAAARRREVIEAAFERSLAWLRGQP